MEGANSSTQQGQGIVIRGTLNAALANTNGIVVVTDSIQTSGSHQLTDPGKKLFKVDQDTVCTIAGFGSEKLSCSPLS